jgi:hypothetical protein
MRGLHAGTADSGGLSPASGEMMASMHGYGPICPVCGKQIDPSGPAVSSRPQPDSTGGEWTANWVPFVEDLRGTPTRLVHAECYVHEHGLPALIAVLHERDRVQRLQEYHRWQQSRRRRQPN